MNSWVRRFNRDTLKAKLGFLIRLKPFAPLVLGALLLLVLATTLFVSLNESRVFAIQAIPLEWQLRLNDGRMENEIARTIEAGIGAKFGPVMGQRPWEIDLKSLRESIQILPWIKEARIQRVFPDRLVVSILPKRPLAVIVASKSPKLLQPISYDGEIMPQWTSGVVPDVPYLRGDVFLKDADLREKAVALIRALPREGILSRANVAEISWVSADPTSKGFSILLLSPRTEIRLGDSEIETKLARVAHVLNYLSTQGKKAPVIDSTSVKKVVVRAHHRP